ncbi:hypothetical protein GCM10010398_62340 [Streptomyces fimbriatus]
MVRAAIPWGGLTGHWTIMRAQAANTGRGWRGPYCMLDPIKVTLTCPGLDATGVMSNWGIPARVLTAYLSTRGIVVEKTDSYTTLVLFSMGITKGKWGTLLDALMDFKDLYDGDAPLDRVLPALVTEHPQRYAGRSLRALCQKMHEAPDPRRHRTDPSGGRTGPGRRGDGHGDAARHPGPHAGRKHRGGRRPSAALPQRPGVLRPPIPWLRQRDARGDPCP